MTIDRAGDASPALATRRGAPRSSRACSRPARRSRATSRPGRHFADVRYEDFLASAAAIGEPAGRRRHTRRSARRSAWPSRRPRAGRARTRISASCCCWRRWRARRSLDVTGDRPTSGTRGSGELRRARRVLDDDDRGRRARRVRGDSPAPRPADSDEAAAQDVADEPTMTLLEVMRLAADRDGDRARVRDGVRGDVRDGRARARARAPRRALVGRRGRRDVPDAAGRGAGHARRPARRRGCSRGGVAAGARRAGRGRRPLGGGPARDRRRWIAGCATRGNIGNPGTTADLTAAAIFVVLLGGGWTLGDISDGIAMQRRGEFRVSVTKDYLVFASAHFITFAGHRCEGLHGHNYRARVTLEGALDEESWFVFDFVDAQEDHAAAVRRDRSQGAAAAPEPEDPGRRGGRIGHGGVRRQAALRLSRAATARCCRFPNTTVEMLAELLTRRLRGELEAMGAQGLTAIEMEVEENFGQSAVYRETL